jgi:hypothetical protein
MSRAYDTYLEEHRSNVHKAFEWMCEHIPDIFKDEETKHACEHQCTYSHDQSKYDAEEYAAYDAYFYGGNKSYAVTQEFNRAWLHHIHCNPHHWQHWILINDDANLGDVVLDIPLNYIIEMVCDWWSFSWASGHLDEIFDWYEEHSSYIKLSDDTKETVEHILDLIKQNLEKHSG